MHSPAPLTCCGDDCAISNAKVDVVFVGNCTNDRISCCCWLNLAIVFPFFGLGKIGGIPLEVPEAKSAAAVEATPFDVVELVLNNAEPHRENTARPSLTGSPFLVPLSEEGDDEDEVGTI